MTLLLSSSICSTMADTGGEATLASTAARAGAVCATGAPGDVDAVGGEQGGEGPGRHGRRVGRTRLQVVRVVGILRLPAAVSRPWSTSSETIGVTSPELM